jgi:hypothetical protein
MGEVSTIGLDIAKSVFQVHGMQQLIMPAPVSRAIVTHPRLVTQ